MLQNTPISPLKTAAYTLLALIAFAANSVLCRMALEMRVDGAAIDAGSFTVLRLASGIAALFIILAIKSKLSKKSVATDSDTPTPSRGSWFSGIMLFVYAGGFSYAYISLETATGALILFAMVQMTMIFMSLYAGHKLAMTEWLGLLLAFSGLVYLMLPGASAPSNGGVLLMSAAGIGWGFYTLAGKSSRDPLLDTSYNFLRTLPFIAVLALFNLDSYYLSTQGVVLAIVSGAITSGLGYTLWYVALTSLKTLQAAVLQLLVPVIAAVGGVLFIEEVLSARLIISALLILGGIGLVVAGKKLLSASAKILGKGNKV